MMQQPIDSSQYIELTKKFAQFLSENEDELDLFSGANQYLAKYKDS